MAIWLKQSTASQEVPLGYFVDSTDGNTEETALTIANTDIKIWKAGATTLANKNSGGATHISNGVYYAVLDATDTNTLGPLVVFVHVSGALSVRVECLVVPANVYDSLIAGSDVLQADVTQFGGTNGTFASGRPEVNSTHWGGTAVASATVNANATQISGDSVAADNLEALLDGTGGVTLVASAITLTTPITANVTQFGGVAGTFSSGRPETNTSHWGGTAVASALVRGNVIQWTGTNVAAPDTAGHPKVTIKSGTGTGELSISSGLLAWNPAWDAEAQSECNDALVALGLDHLLSTSVAGTDVADNSIFARLVSSSATADWDTYNQADDSLQAIRDRGDAAWTTGGGGGGDATAANQTTIINHLTDIKGATFSGSTDSLEAIRDRGDAAWTTGAGGSASYLGNLLEVFEDIGYRPEDGTVYHEFTTRDNAGDLASPSAVDVDIYKDNGTTEKTTANGITVSVDFDARTGVHQIVIDTSNNTGDSGFWEAGHDYTVVLTATIPNATYGGADLTDSRGFIFRLGYVQTNVKQVSDSGTAADNAETCFTGTITTLDGLDTAQDTQHGTTQAAITALNNLSAADVNAQVDVALADIHLDHLLAADYDPASKPGVSTALFNELIENDGGISRFTANALEQAPAAGSAYFPWATIHLSSTSGTNAYMRVALFDSDFGSETDIEALDAAATGAITVRAYGSAEGASLFTDTFAAADIKNGAFEKTYASPNFAANTLYIATVSVTVSGTTYTNYVPIPVGP